MCTSENAYSLVEYSVLYNSVESSWFIVCSSALALSWSLSSFYLLLKVGYEGIQLLLFVKFYQSLPHGP
jgi:hypothetical protein